MAISVSFHLSFDLLFYYLSTLVNPKKSLYLVPTSSIIYPPITSTTEMSTPNGPIPTGDQVPKLLGTIITFDILALMIVILRFVSRRIAHADLWWDDWLMLPAFVCLDSNRFSLPAHTNVFQITFIASIVVDAGGIGARLLNSSHHISHIQISRMAPGSMCKRPACKSFPTFSR